MTIHISDLLQELTDPAGDDILVAVDVSESLPADQTKRALLKRLGLGNGGWTEIPDGSWTYVSSTRIAMVDANLILSVGDQIRYKQGGAFKYGYVIATTSTYYDVTGGSDYSVANSAITDAAFSKGGGVGHPGWFNYLATVSGSEGSAGTYAESIPFQKFHITGRSLSVVVSKAITNKGSWSGSFYVLLPRTPATQSNNTFVMSAGVLPQATYSVKGIGDLRSFSQNMLFEKSPGTAVLTWADIAVNDFISINMTYPI